MTWVHIPALGRWEAEITQADIDTAKQSAILHPRQNARTVNQTGHLNNFIVLHKLEEFFQKHNPQINLPGGYIEVNHGKTDGGQDIILRHHPKVKVNTSDQYRSIEASFLKHGSSHTALFVQITKADKTLDPGDKIQIVGFSLIKDLAQRTPRPKGSILLNGTRAKNSIIELRNISPEILKFSTGFII